MGGDTRKRLGCNGKSETLNLKRGEPPRPPSRTQTKYTGGLFSRRLKSRSALCRSRDVALTDLSFPSSIGNEKKVRRLYRAQIGQGKGTGTATKRRAASKDFFWVFYGEFVLCVRMGWAKNNIKKKTAVEHYTPKNFCLSSSFV